MTFSRTQSAHGFVERREVRPDTAVSKVRPADRRDPHRGHPSPGGSMCFQRLRTLLERPLDYLVRPPHADRRACGPPPPRWSDSRGLHGDRLQPDARVPGKHDGGPPKLTPRRLDSANCASHSGAAMALATKAPPAVDAPDAGVIEDARRRQRRHRHVGGAGRDRARRCSRLPRERWRRTCGWRVPDG
jgi:hypothetical protein